MAGFLLDTNVLSELRKGARTSPRVREWLESVPDESLWLSVLVLGEIRQGIERCRSRDPKSAAHLERWLAKLALAYRDRVLDVDTRVAEQWGRLNAPSPLPAIDGLLAATALVHELTLVTRNTADIARSGVRMLDPFEPK